MPSLEQMVPTASHRT